MPETISGLGPAERKRIASLRERGEFFWLDVSMRDTDPEELRKALDLRQHALTPLLEFDRHASPSKKFHAGGNHVVFPFNAFLELPEDEAHDDEEPGPRLRPIEVHVLVCGEYMLTVHREKRPLQDVLSGYTPEDRSEQYVVYAVLDAMVATAFDALNDAELALESMQLVTPRIGSARVRMQTLRAISVRLATMRRQIGPQRGIFERISEEISQIEGLGKDEENYFERIYGQLNRMIDAIDATSATMARLIDLRLNETIYWLTVVATIFLPLTLVTSFFGMNFKYMTDNIDTPEVFLALGLGLPALLGFATWVVVQRRGSPVAPDQTSVERLVSAVRK